MDANAEDRLTIEVIGHIARRAQGLPPDLPHPFTTDTELARYLHAATEIHDAPNAADPDAPRWQAVPRQALTRVVSSANSTQRQFNDLLINLIHQLDHRDRQQREELADLRQQLDTLTAQLASDRPVSTPCDEEAGR